MLVPFNQLKADITLKITPALAIKVSSPETQSKALEAGREIKAYQKKIEETRKTLVAPLNDQVKAINAYAKTLSEPIEQVETHLKKELVAFERELEKVRAEAQRKLEEETRKRAEEAARIAEEKRQELEMKSMFSEPEEAQREEIVAKVEEEQAQAEIVHLHKQQSRQIEATKVAGTRKTWTFKITDESQVPREFLMVDEKKIREAVRAGTREIAGVEVFQETSVALGR